MTKVPFFKFLEGEGLSFGISRELIEGIADRTRAGIGCAELLDDPALEAAGVGPTHILRIRRAWRRHQARAANPPQEDAKAADTLKRGRLRFHLKRPDDPRLEDLAGLAEHSEGCDEIPAHRWYAADRGVRDGLLWIEVIPPEGEPDPSVDKIVLRSIAERSERRAIQTAADALYSLLSRPPISAPVAGVVSDTKRTWVQVVDGESAEFGFGDLEGLCAWLERREIEHVGVARISGRGSLSEIIQRLSTMGLSVEPVRQAGLMKQAKKLGGAIKPAAAEVTARRLKDPLMGYADLEDHELGLGEYLDQVDADRLRGALADIRQVAEWERRHGKTKAPVARGVGTSPMVKDLADLRPGMQLTGTVANLTNFGAFVELGLSAQGLIHLSELSEKFVKHPSEVVQVGDRVRVRVLAVDLKKQRISLSLREDRDTSRRGPKDKRAEAIRDLDKLFKK
jgi:predicted RNA-binding protein with RPS1 domain